MTTDTTMSLPGDIPGLLRLCSPVLFNGAPAVLVGLDLDSDLVAHAAPRPGTRKHGTYAVSQIDRLWLDLTDGTGRAHAAWWFRPHSGTTSARPFRVRQVQRAGHPAGVAIAGWCCGEGWVDRGQGLSLDRVCPALADLDPDDPRLLDDGSRWVDAEALRLVCLQEAGRS